MKYRVTLENSGGELDSTVIDIEAEDDPQLTEAVVDFITDTTLRDGDIIRIRAKT